MHYTGQVYRHPVEGATPLLEVTAGCSHNKCSFCTMYRETPFKVSNLAHVEEDLQELKQVYGSLERICLVNGEPFVLATEKLVVIGELIKKYFPEIQTITCYASIKGLKNKTVEDLKRLKALKYNDLHIGLESASDSVLSQMNKGFTKDEAYENLEKLSQAGIAWDAILMLGAAGKGGENHIVETAELLNKFPPYMVSIMTTSVQDNTPLEIMRDNGEFIECSEREKIEEEKMLLKLLKCDDAYFFGGHFYNSVRVNGYIHQKAEILEYIDKVVAKMDSEYLDTSFQRENI